MGHHDSACERSNMTEGVGHEPMACRTLGHQGYLLGEDEWVWLN